MAKPPSDKKPRKNAITLPEGFEPPATEVGSTFEAVVEIKREKDGYSVESLDGIPMESDEADEAEEEIPETIGMGAKNKMMEGY